jgi:diacylglycerol kinase family enzyme
VVGNTRRYGGFTAITPDALADDGLLDLSLLAPDGLLHTARLLAMLILRGRPAGRGVIRRRAATVAIHAPAPIPVQLDGDPLPPTAQGIAAPYGVVYRFSALAGASTMLVPREYRGPLLGAYPRHAARDVEQAIASGHDDLDAMGLGAVGHFERAGEPE